MHSLMLWTRRILEYIHRLTLKHLGHSFQNVIWFDHWNILAWNYYSTMNIWSALWLLMTWCFSTGASVATVLNTHSCISSCLRVNIFEEERVDILRKGRLQLKISFLWSSIRFFCFCFFWPKAGMARRLVRPYLVYTWNIQRSAEIYILFKMFMMEMARWQAYKCIRYSLVPSGVFSI